MHKGLVLCMLNHLTIKEFVNMEYKSFNFNIFIEEDFEQMGKKAANIFAQNLKDKPKASYGFATGSTPISMYNHLIEMYKNNEIDFSSIKSFNLDEYYPMEAQSKHSYHYFMQKYLFNSINIKKDNINLPDGNNIKFDKVCKEYEEKILNNGGIELQILGIGTNGHIGFNEPSDTFGSFTRKVSLVQSTIEANSKNFEDINQVPKEAITMGIRSIMMSNKILIIANGEKKAKAIHDMIFGDITPKKPCTALQLHKNVTVVVDKLAGAMILKK
jgi:glucosamine-6-phosphate deaminase